MPVLHVTNGDHAVERLREAGFGEPALPWRDVLHDGPVPQGTDDALREVRARFLAERGWTALELVRTELARRDDALAGALADADREVVLWFEHDLYDQLQLAQVLDAVARHPARRARVRAVHAGEFLGRAAADRLRTWHALAHDLTEAEVEAGRAAWHAWRAPDPRPLDALANSTRTAALPFMRDALRRAVQELPGRADGLARSERQLLRAIADGAGTGVEAFAAAQRMEDASFLGDASVAWYLRRLATCRVPLVSAGASLLANPPALDAQPLALTEAGASVLAGEGDHVALNGVVRWLGGTLLDGASPWRSDGTRAVRVTGR